MSAIETHSALAITLTLGMIFIPHVSMAVGSAPDPRMLGVAESIVSYCTRVDPPSATKLKEKVKELLKGVSAATAAALRKTEEYKAGYAELTDFVSKVDKKNAVAPCKTALSEPKAEAP